MSPRVTVDWIESVNYLVVLLWGQKLTRWLQGTVMETKRTLFVEKSLLSFCVAG